MKIDVVIAILEFSNGKMHLYKCDNIFVSQFHIYRIRNESFIQLVEHIFKLILGLANLYKRICR